MKTLLSRFNFQKQWVRVVLAVALFVTVLFVFSQEVGFLFAEDPRVVDKITESFNNGVVQKPKALEKHGFVAGPKGWYLPPHSKGSLVYRPLHSVEQNEVIYLSLLFYKALPEVTNSLKLSLDSGTTYVSVVENANLFGSRIDLTPFMPNGGAFELFFEASNNSSSTVLVLDKMKIQIFDTRPPEPPSPLRMVLAFFSLGLVFILFTPNWKRFLPILGIVGLGLLLRYLNLIRVIYSTLEPDAEGYKNFADNLVPFTDMGFYSAKFSMREPFFLLVTKGFFQIFGSSDTHLRLLTLFLSLLVVYFVYRIVKELFGKYWGVLAGLVIALNLPFVIESGRGLRLELEMVLILLFCYVGFIRKEMRPLLRFVFLGVIGGFTILTRSSYLPCLSFLAIVAAVYHRKGIKDVVLLSFTSIVIMVALLAPHQYSIYQKHGDLFWDSNIHTRWLANREFQGQPGFPTIEEIEKNAYVGPKLTYIEYLFRLHTPREVMTGTLQGFYKIASHMDVIGYHEQVAAIIGFKLQWMDQIFRILGILGFFTAILLSRYRWLPLAFLSLIFPVAFLYDKGLTEPYRLTMQAFPFFLFCAILPVRYVSGWVWDKIKASGIFPAYGRLTENREAHDI